MAASVASSSTKPTAGADNRSAPQEFSGASYAHAVLNFKSNDHSNKENINEAQKDVQPRTIKQEVLRNPKEAGEPSSLDDGDSFTPVVSHSRKDRRSDKNRREKLRETGNKPFVNGNGNGNGNEKRDTHLVTKEHHPNHTLDKEEAQDTTKKVFVEAPLPKVNPWQQNRNVVQTVPAKETQSEKRVLQPQKQGTNINGQVLSAVVRPPKDRRRFNQKVGGFYCY